MIQNQSSFCLLIEALVLKLSGYRLCSSTRLPSRIISKGTSNVVAVLAKYQAILPDSLIR